MVQHDVEDDPDASRVGAIDEFNELLFGRRQRSVRGEAGVELDKVLRSVAVVVPSPAIQLSGRAFLTTGDSHNAPTPNASK
jgi:hypothetical protein